MNNQEPKNLFLTKHFLALIGVFYITTLSPAIDNAIDGNLTKQEVAKTINALVVTLFGASLKAFDKDVYTPKGFPGKNKSDLLDGINYTNNQQAEVQTQNPIQTVTNLINNPVKAVEDNLANNLANNPIKTIESISNNPLSIVTDVINQPIKEVEAIINNPAKAVNDMINNPLSTITGVIGLNPLGEINNLFGSNSNNNNDTSNSVNTANTVPFDLKNVVTDVALIVQKDTFFKDKPIDSGDLKDNEKIKILANATTYIDSYSIDLITNHVKFTIKNQVLYAYIPHIKIIDDGKEVVLVSSNFRPTLEQCNTIYGTRLSSDEYTDFINCLNTFNINTKLDVAHFISQTAHESGGLRYNKEIADGSDYEGRSDLGNVIEGDGPRYKGAGFIQLTGRANYQDFSDYIRDPKVMDGVDYVSIKYPFTSAGFWWYNNRMSTYINNNQASVQQVTQVVNGGQNGIEDRKEYFSVAANLFNI